MRKHEPLVAAAGRSCSSMSPRLRQEPLGGRSRCSGKLGGLPSSTGLTLAAECGRWRIQAGGAAFKGQCLFLCVEIGMLRLNPRG